ncbi:MAG: chloride channel protein, partial [Candidatus Binatia bacterium]
MTTAASPGRRSWRSFLHESEGWLLVVAIAIGVAAAVANVVFHSTLNWAYRFFWGGLGVGLRVGARSPTTDVFRDGWSALPESWWMIPLLPMTGMALLVLLNVAFPGEIHGYGLPRFLEIVNVQGGYIKRRWITLKTLAAAITLGSGMSAGIEGPVAQIGGAIGSTIARVLRPSP